MDQESQQYARLECIKAAVESGSPCDSVIEYAGEFFDYILSGRRKEATVVKLVSNTVPPKGPAA